MAFTNVDYNKVQYADGNPYEEAFDRSLNRSKNFAVEALEKKKSEFMHKLGNHLEGNMMPPAGATVVVKGPDGNPMLDPGFYQLLEYTPQEVWNQVQQLAHAEGIGPHTLDKNEILSSVEGLRKNAATRQYKMLRNWGNENGKSNLDNLLHREGGKFQSFYNEYTDAYHDAGLRDLTKREKRFDEGSMIPGMKNEWVMNSEGQVTDNPYTLDFGGATDVQYDQDGKAFVESMLGFSRYYLPEELGLNGGDMSMNPIAVANQNIKKQGP